MDHVKALTVSSTFTRFLSFYENNQLIKTSSSRNVGSIYIPCEAPTNKKNMCILYRYVIYPETAPCCDLTYSFEKPVETTVEMSLFDLITLIVPCSTDTTSQERRNMSVDL